MLTDQDLADLLGMPKQIAKRTPERGFREEGGHRRCDLTVEFASEHGGQFTVFMRQNSQFIENFTLGLRFQPAEPPSRTLTIVRYNGPHGETSRDEDGHYSKPHIHRLTAEHIARGSVQPRPEEREITERYGTFEQAISVFCEDVNLQNYGDYFPHLQQGRLFDGHR